MNFSGALRPLAARSLRVPLPCYAPSLVTPLPCYDPLHVPRLHLGVRDCPAAGQSRAPECNLAEEWMRRRRCDPGRERPATGLAYAGCGVREAARIVGKVEL